MKQKSKVLSLVVAVLLILAAIPFTGLADPDPATCQHEWGGVCQR